MSYQDRKDDHIRLFRAFYRKTSNDFDHVVLFTMRYRNGNTRC